MAGRQFCPHPAGVSGLNAYAHLFDGVGAFWNGTSHAAFDSVDWADYWVQMSEYESSGIYYFDWPAMDGGVYAWLGYLQASGTTAPDSAATDLRLGSGGPICWDGAGIETFLLGNPAAHDTILLPYLSGLTVYGVVFNDAGQVWDGSSPSAYAAGSWSNYDANAPELSGSQGLYEFTFPSGITTPGRYTIVFCAGSVAVGDAKIGSVSVDWSGTAIASLHSYLANFSAGRNIPQVYRRVA